MRKSLGDERGEMIKDSKNGVRTIEMGNGDVLVNSGFYPAGEPKSMISFAEATEPHIVGEACWNEQGSKTVDEDMVRKVRITFTDEGAIDVVILKLNEARLDLRARKKNAKMYYGPVRLRHG